ncbi:MAG: dihydrolipoyllysine-residue acetyltransferase [Gammaproteobacteria bacterium]|jgi:pyruvate dehydrogenase E2 component (dihydrolipoamide acetyltransferase)
MSKTVEVKVPDIGDFKNVDIIDVMVKAGDRVEAEDGLITLETDKAAMDVPSPQAGTVREMKVGNGDKVSEGDVILVLEVAGDAGGDTPDKAAGKGDEKKGDEKKQEKPAKVAKKKAAAKKKAGEKQIREVTVPDIGDFEGVDVIDVMVSAGDSVEAEDGLITLETDKAAMDVPAPWAGTIREMKIATGDKVSEGDVIATIETVSGEEAGDEEAETSEAPAQEASGRAEAKRETPSEAERISHAPTPDKSASLPPIDDQAFSKAHASPSVRKFARELGVALERVSGSGRKGRITFEDVKGFVKQVMQSGGGGGGLPQVPRVDFARFGEIETKPLPRIKKISGPRLQASWVNAPHVTQHDEADITDLETVRKALKSDAEKQDVKLTPLAFIIKACVQALQEYPDFNSSLDGQNLVYKKYYHIGFAADTPQGLMVPVIRDADQMNVFEIAGALADLSARARDGKLKADEMQGGTFSVSSLGGIGGTAFTPIVNAPEVAILGVSKASMKPVWDGSAFQPRLMLPLSLSYDHRVVDGAAAVRFTRFLADVLENVRNLVL